MKIKQYIIQILYILHCGKHVFNCNYLGSHVECHNIIVPK